MTAPSDRADSPARILERLLELALGYPGAWVDHPWGETVVKVDKKVFVFLGVDGEEDRVGFGVKLHASHAEALGVDGITQMGYGLGRAGWVNVRLTKADVPLGVYEDWVEESYRAVALKRRVAELERRTQAG
jgi:predicted DNA-binding protein (MmcQ/YjbR family)